MKRVAFEAHARSLDGKLPVGMLVQYLKLLSSYHGQFLDRLQRKAVGDKLKKEGGAQHNPFGRGGRHRPRDTQVPATEGRVESRVVSGRTPQHRHTRHTTTLAVYA